MAEAVRKITDDIACVRMDAKQICKTAENGVKQLAKELKHAESSRTVELSLKELWSKYRI